MLSRIEGTQFMTLMLKSGRWNHTGNQTGFVLPMVIILSLVIMTGLSVWYRQVVVQSFLSEQLVNQHAAYQECWSLVPVLIEALDTLDPPDLLEGQSNFYSVTNNSDIIWMIDRSAITNDLVVFTFRAPKHPVKTITLPVNYKR